MNARHHAAVAALLVVAAVAPASVLAQSSTGELTAEPTEHRVAGELGFFYRREGEADIAILQPSFYGNFTVAHLSDAAFVQIDAAWRMIGLFGDLSAFRAMNPFIGARIGAGGGAPTDRWRARGGVGFTLPLTNAYDDFRGGPFGRLSDGLFAQILVPGMQGVYDDWLTSPLNAAVVFRGDFEYRGEYFFTGVDTALAALLPVEYDGRTGDTLIDLQLGAFAGGRPIPALALGVRFQAVALITTRDTMGVSSNAEGYTSLIPFVRGEFGHGFVEGRLLMNLDTPWGFAFDSGTTASGVFIRVWAIQVSAGATF